MIRQYIEDYEVNQYEEYVCYSENHPYVMAAMQVLGKDLKETMFKCDFEQGICSVVLMHLGQKFRIVMDDFIPCIAGEPIFGENQSNALWVTFVEKALAKVYGSYKNLAVESGKVKSADELIEKVCY